MEGKIYENYTLEWEISNFIKVWVSVIASLLYCKAATKIFPRGRIRLFAFIPVVCLFLVLPLQLHSMHLGGMSCFFIAWLANFKILSLAFDKGPLSDPSLSLPQFVAIGCFPIKVQQNQNSKKAHKPIWNYALKGFLVAVLVRIYDYSDHIHPWLVLVLYCFHIYFMLELILATLAALASATLGLELEPQFNDPYLSTSLQDFWGRRWNIMVTRILRPTVYDPALSTSIRVVGRKWAPLPAVFCTFVVSALMHELIFYYLGRSRPTWEITWFFLLHGVSLLVEIGVKKVLNGRYRLPRMVATPMTLGYVVGTGFWLFFPALLRCKSDVRASEEYAIVGAFLRDVVGGAVKSGHFNSTVVPM
ncbi:Acyl-CoA--sterol O-acyltransferase [Actinidia chinensis var. chinensis]|uniref:Acyl-CoA--sterol O-acyltransferase n=1 Tax=Actinidia chinensis var. chinensis TaxID=1590841 RepID=A0A2R6RB43_ACTCC|nr:Acyl-CoA--sterol O-acyltransferase [Actinidia chinensis var. chinensis]